MGKRSIFLENVFRYAGNFDDLNKLENPKLELTERKNLTVSYRFDKTLAEILDKYIYKIGLHSKSENDTFTFIQCIHCGPKDVYGRQRRQNHSEANAILKNLKNNGL